MSSFALMHFGEQEGKGTFLFFIALKEGGEDNGIF